MFTAQSTNPYSTTGPTDVAEEVVEDYDILSVKQSGPSIDDILKKPLTGAERARASIYQHKARDEDEDEAAPLPPSIKGLADGRALKPFCVKHLSDAPAAPEAAATTKMDALCVSIAKNGSSLAVGCHNGSVMVLNIRTLEVMDVFEVGKDMSSAATLGGLSTAVTAAKFRPTPSDKAMQNVLLLATGERVVHLHTSTGRVLSDIHEAGNNISALAVRHDGGAFATAGNDMTIRLYDEASGKPTSELKFGDNINTAGHSSRIFSVTWKPDDPNVLVSGGWDKTVQLWDVRLGRSVASVYGPYICGDAIDVHNNKLLTGSWRQSNPLQLWDLRTCRLLTNLHFHQQELGSCLLYCAKFLVGGPEVGGIVAAGSGKHPCVKVYLQDGEIVGTLKSASSVHSVDSIEPAPGVSMLAVCGATQLQMVSFS